MRQEIIPFRASAFNIETAVQEVGLRTGDFQPFFCPTNFTEGEPFEGHVHVFLATGIEQVEKLIDMDKPVSDPEMDSNN